MLIFKGFKGRLHRNNVFFSSVNPRVSRVFQGFQGFVATLNVDMEDSHVT